VVDQATGTVFLFYNQSFRDAGNTGCSADRSRLYFRKSTDAGLHWTAPTELTGLFANNAQGWTQHGPTPGHGIQLDSGRLLMPLTHRREFLGNPVPARRYGVSMVYSDDHGASWKWGKPVPVSETYPIGENRVFQRADGAVIVNGRYGSGGVHSRITSVSADGGVTWADPMLDSATGQLTAVDAGFARYSGGRGSPDANRVLFSRPDAPTRQNMTVSVSYDEGNSYRYRRVVNPGPSYYSDLAVTSDGTILLLYGRDGIDPTFPERVAVARFNLEWLTGGLDDPDTGPPFTEHEWEFGTSVSYGSPNGPGPTVVTDIQARGGLALRYVAPATGHHVEIPFVVPTTGNYEVAVRYARDADRAAVQVSMDGTNLANGAFDPTMTASESYQVYRLGSRQLTAGLHVIRFTVTGPGRDGGYAVTPDQLTLIST
jgi:hypothetical protein